VGNVVDPQICTDEQLRSRMRRYAKLEPEFLADMMQSEQRLYVPKREIPIPRVYSNGQAVLRGGAA